MKAQVLHRLGDPDMSVTKTTVHLHRDTGPFAPPTTNNPK